MYASVLAFIHPARECSTDPYFSSSDHHCVRIFHTSSILERVMQTFIFLSTCVFPFWSRLTTESSLLSEQNVLPLATSSNLLGIAIAGTDNMPAKPIAATEKDLCIESYLFHQPSNEEQISVNRKERASTLLAEVLRFGFRTTRQALGDPAGVDAHHCAVGLSGTTCSKKPPPRQGLGTLKGCKSVAVVVRASI